MPTALLVQRSLRVWAGNSLTPTIFTRRRVYVGYCLRYLQRVAHHLGQTNAPGGPHNGPYPYTYPYPYPACTLLPGAPTIGKMASGVPLSDQDRAPWLSCLASFLGQRACRCGSCALCGAHHRPAAMSISTINDVAVNPVLLLQFGLLCLHSLIEMCTVLRVAPPPGTSQPSWHAQPSRLNTGRSCRLG